MFKGREIKRLVLVSALCCIVLILSVSLYLMMSSRSNLRKQTNRMKVAMSENLAQHLQKCFISSYEGLRSIEGIDVGSGGLADLLANQKALYSMFATWVIKCYDAEFVAYYNGDTLLASDAKPGVKIPGPDFKPADGQEYEIVDRLGDREGAFFLFDKESILPGDHVVYAIDNTAQIDSMKTAYQDEKSGMVREQVIVFSIIFLVLLAGSLLLIRFLIMKWLGKPMGRLSEEARRITAGRPVKEEEVLEGSIFANLQRLINSGRAVFAKSGREMAPGSDAEQAVGRKEVNKVIAFWAVVITAMFLLSTVVILIFSISMMNSKSDAIMEKVSEEMAVYYSGAYDSLTSMSLASADISLGKDLFDPNANIDREKSIERLNGFFRNVFDCDAVVSYLETDQGGIYLVSVKPGVTLDYKPSEMGNPLTVYEGFFREGDMVMVMMNPTEYAGYQDQFTYYIIDGSEQAKVFDQLYEDGSSSLLVSQLVLLLIFLVLGLCVSAFAMAWAVRNYITMPIIKLDSISNSLIEGDLDVEISVDEASGFVDMQRLLKQAQELLRSMMEE